MDIFKISDNREFETEALRIFKYQAKNNLPYKRFLKFLNRDPEDILNIKDIPFLPVEFFKSHDVLSSEKNIEETAYIFSPVYFMFACILLSLVVSLIVLIYEIYLFGNRSSCR